VNLPNEEIGNDNGNQPQIQVIDNLVIFRKSRCNNFEIIIIYVLK